MLYKFSYKYRLITHFLFYGTFKSTITEICHHNKLYLTSKSILSFEKHNITFLGVCGAFIVKKDIDK